jgi:hypothetical protein
MTDETRQNYGAVLDIVQKIIVLSFPVVGGTGAVWLDGKFASFKEEITAPIIKHVKEEIDSVGEDYINKNDSVFYYDKRSDQLSTKNEVSEFIKKTNAEQAEHNAPETHFSKSEVVGIYEYQKDGYHTQKQIDLLDNRVKRVEEEVDQIQQQIQ